MTSDGILSTPDIDLSIEGGAWPEINELQALADRAVSATLAESCARLMPAVGLSILLCDDARIRVINRDWRGIDKPTNVLSFPTTAADRLSQTPFLGDIAIAQETVAREAAVEGKTFEDHLAHMIVHGVLHLLGEDHEADDEAERMEELERKALARLGIADPYAGQEPDA